MSTIKEESKLRIDKVYYLCKFALKYKGKDKKVTEVFADVADHLGYSDYGQVGNIYYKMREEDPHPLPRSKAKKKLNTVAYEN